MDVSQYLEIFLDESNEHLQSLSDQLMILEKEPENTKALFYLSIAYMDISRYNEAIEIIDKLIKIEPDNALAYKNRALIKYSQNRDKEAMADYKLFVKLSQKD